MSVLIRGVLLSLVVLLLVGADIAVAQVNRNNRRGTRNPRDLSRAPTYRTASQLGRNPLSLSGGSAYRGFQTRADQLNSLIERTIPKRSSLASSSLRKDVTNPAEWMLDRRNLLGARSPLGKRSTMANQYGESFDAAGDSGEEAVAPGEEAMLESSMRERPTTGDYLVSLADGLKAKADENHEIGKAYFRAGDWSRARGCFAMDREINRESARPFVSDVLVAVETRDLNRAYVSLLLALSRAKTGTDLRVDKLEYYTDDSRWERTFSLINLQAGQNAESMPQQIMLAFYAWINGDLGTARATISRAERIGATSEEPNVKLVQKFAAFLQEPEKTVPTPLPGTEDR